MARFHARRVAALVVFALALAVLGIAIAGRIDQQWRQERDGLEAKYGVKIGVAEIDVPQQWRNSDASYRTVTLLRRRGALRALAIDLSRYDPAFLKRHLKRVFVLDSLRLRGYAYGGTTDASAGSLYIDFRWLGDWGERREAMGFHHEFSSLWLRALPDRQLLQRWSALNPSGFRYRHAVSSWRNLAEGDPDLVGNERLYALGFLCGYGQNTLEDDINTYAQYFFGKPTRLQELGERHPAIRRKIALMRDYLQGIDGLPATP